MAVESNIWKYTLLLITNKRVFVAILGAYYLTIPDVTVAWIGILLLIGSLTGFLFEIPSGYFSDRIGHKEALIISRIAAVLSTLFFLLADSISFLILGSILLSLSSTFISGTGSAFMHETLRALNREKEYTAIMGKISSIGFAVPIVLMVLLPFLVGINYKIPFLVALIIDVVGLITACALVRPSVPVEHVEEIDVAHFGDVIRDGRQCRFFRYALFSGIIFGLLFTVSIFRAPYQVFLGIPVIWFGVLHGAGRVLASLLLAYSGRLSKVLGGITQFYRFQLIMYALLFLLLATVSLWWIIAGAFIVINGLQWGMSKVEEGYLIERIQKSRFKATLLSIRAQIGELSSALFGVILGFVIQNSSYQYGFLVLGIGVFLIVVPLYFYISKHHTAAYQLYSPAPVRGESL